MKTLLPLTIAVALLLSAARAEDVTIDFARTTTTSSHLLFGGCSPVPEHGAVWRQLAAAGVTSLRFDVMLGLWPDTQHITLEQYRAEMGKPGGVADINSRHWDWSRFDGCLAICEANGIEPLGILDYCPTWLSYAGHRHSPPRDFAVWRDLIRQIVQRYAGRVKRWEIWNEPNGPGFMKLEDSPYPAGKDGMLAAYVDICRHTQQAVKESGVKVQLGGPVLATWNSAPWIDGFLAHTEVSRSLDFVSHHIYFHTPIPNRCFPPTIAALQQKHGVGPLPLWITEWNADSGVVERTHPLKKSPASVGFIGKAFTLFLQWGVQAAHFYTFTEGVAHDDGRGGAYLMVDGQPEFFRHVKVFHLLSRVLDLGDPSGPILVCESRVAGLAAEETLPPHFLDSLYAVGCRTAKNLPVAIVTNPSSVARTANVSLHGLAAGRYVARAFVVRPDHTPAEALVPTLLFERPLEIAAAAVALDFEVTPQTVVGLRLERAPDVAALPSAP